MGENKGPSHPITRDEVDIIRSFTKKKKKNDINLRLIKLRVAIHLRLIKKHENHIP